METVAAIWIEEALQDVSSVAISEVAPQEVPQEDNAEAHQDVVSSFFQICSFNDFIFT